MGDFVAEEKELSEVIDSLQRAIGILEKEMAKPDLKAVIDEETATAESLTTKVEELTASIATDEADLDAATKIRARESADFVAEEKELSEVIDSLQRAIGILEREMAKHGASMMQIKNAGSLAKTLQVL